MIKVTENACPFAQNTLGSPALNTMIKAELKKKKSLKHLVNVVNVSGSLITNM